MIVTSKFNWKAVGHLYICASIELSDISFYVGHYCNSLDLQLFKIIYESFSLTAYIVFLHTKNANQDKEWFLVNDTWFLHVLWAKYVVCSK